MAHRLQYRRDTKANWLKYNPVLMEGEVGYETDTHHQKVGDGVSTYSELEYEVGVGNITQETGDSESLVMSQKAVSNKLYDLVSEVGLESLISTNNNEIFIFNARYTKGTGDYVEGGSYNTTDFIPLRKIKGLEIEYAFPEEASVNRITLFSENKDFVDFDSSLNKIVIDDIITNNHNAYYIRFSCKTTDLNTLNVLQSNVNLYKEINNNKEEQETKNKELETSIVIGKQVLINHHYFSDGKLQSYLGRVAINGFFSTDKEVIVSAKKKEEVLYDIVRYYDKDFNHLGTVYSESAKYFTIAFLVNEGKRITEEDVLGITIQINGVLYDIVANTLFINTKVVSELEMTKQVLLNYQYYTDGKLEKKQGRVAINGYIAISEQPYVVVYDKDNIALTSIVRYYDGNFEHLGTTYSSAVRYCTIAFVVNDAIKLILDDIKGYRIHLNGVDLSIISDSLLVNAIQLAVVDSELMLLSSNPLGAFLAKNTTYSIEAGEKVTGIGRTYDSTYMININDIASLDITYEHPSAASVNKVSLFDENKVYIGNTQSTNVNDIKEEHPNAVYVVFSIAHSLKHTLKCWYSKLPLKWDGKFPYKEEEERIDFSSDDFEQGGLSNGQSIESETRIRLNKVVKANIGDRYVFSVKTGYYLNIHFMSEPNTYGGAFSGWKEYFDFVNEFPYMKIAVKKVNDSVIQPTENVELSYINWRKVPDEIVGKSQINGIGNKSIYIPLLAAKIFRRVGCIGDSYTAGYIKLTPEGLPNNTYPLWSWVHYMKNITGETWENWGRGGSTAKSWIEGAANLDQVTKEGNKCQAYVIGLMINDQNSGNPYYTPLGTTEDIGTDADTYYAYYYKLVKKCVEVNPSAKIFCNTCPKSGTRYAQYNQAVRDIVEYCYNTEGLNVYLCDLASDRYMTEEYYGNAVFTDDYIQGHYSPICYEFMAECFVKVMSNVIMENLKDFQNTFLIEYDEV